MCTIKKKEPEDRMRVRCALVVEGGRCGMGTRRGGECQRRRDNGANGDVHRRKEREEGGIKLLWWKI